MSKKPPQNLHAQNLLADEHSPYLLQHKDNPVHWQAWGQAALRQAQAADKPILLSVGYAACHWCHVMAHESFEDAATAAIMNELFINIKLDREERPDIDELYMSALHMMGEQGGWPLTMFLMPDGAPFWGGTYFPKQAQYGRPAFTDVLREVSRLYQDEGDKVASNATQLTAALTAQANINTSTTPMMDSVSYKAATALSAYMDAERGGMAGAPKFPQCAMFQFIWQEGYWHKDAGLKNIIHVTAQHMACGGIYDHLGGGFSRYSVDADWLVPHFEKMLYDNAQLLDLYAQLWRDTANPLYQQRIEQTVDWLAREMTHDEGGFFASLDADSEGEEGKFYVWSAQEINSLLTPKNKTQTQTQTQKAQDFCTAYDVSVNGNFAEDDFTGANILNTLSMVSNDTPLETAQKFTPQRDILFDARTARIRPACDDKILADWNGLMIGALARLAPLFDRPDWLAAAEKAYDFIRKNMTYENPTYKDAPHKEAPHKEERLAKLSHSWRESWRTSWRDKAKKPHLKTQPLGLALGLAEDYANMIDASLTLFSATGNQAYLTDACDWEKTLTTDFSASMKEKGAKEEESGAEEAGDGDKFGGYYMSAHAAKDVPTRIRTAKDSATPNANGTMIWVLARLHAFTGAPDYLDRARNLADAFAHQTVNQFAQMPTLIGHHQRLHRMRHCVLVGNCADKNYTTLRNILMRHPDPSLIVQCCAETDTLDAQHPVFLAAHSKKAVDGKPSVYICQHQTCQPPITEVEELKKHLDAV